MSSSTPLDEEPRTGTSPPPPQPPPVAGGESDHGDEKGAFLPTTSYLTKVAVEVRETMAKTLRAERRKAQTGDFETPEFPMSEEGVPQHPCLRVFGKCAFEIANHGDPHCRFRFFPVNTCLRVMKGRCKPEKGEACKDTHLTEEEIDGYLKQAGVSEVGTMTSTGTAAWQENVRKDLELRNNPPTTLTWTKKGNSFEEVTPTKGDEARSRSASPPPGPLAAPASLDDVDAAPEATKSSKTSISKVAAPVSVHEDPWDQLEKGGSTVVAPASIWSKSPQIAAGQKPVSPPVKAAGAPVLAPMGLMALGGDDDDDGLPLPIAAGKPKKSPSPPQPAGPLLVPVGEIGALDDDDFTGIGSVPLVVKKKEQAPAAAPRTMNTSSTGPSGQGVALLGALDVCPIGTGGQELHPCFRVYGDCKHEGDVCRFSFFPAQTCLRWLKKRCAGVSTGKKACKEFHPTELEIQKYFALAGVEYEIDDSHGKVTQDDIEKRELERKELQSINDKKAAAAEKEKEKAKVAAEREAETAVAKTVAAQRKRSEMTAAAEAVTAQRATGEKAGASPPPAANHLPQPRSATTGEKAPVATAKKVTEKPKAKAESAAPEATGEPPGPSGRRVINPATATTHRIQYYDDTEEVAEKPKAKAALAASEPAGPSGRRVINPATATTHRKQVVVDTEEEQSGPSRRRLPPGMHVPPPSAPGESDKMDATMMPAPRSRVEAEAAVAEYAANNWDGGDYVPLSSRTEEINALESNAVYEEMHAAHPTQVHQAPPAQQRLRLEAKAFQPQPQLRSEAKPFQPQQQAQQILMQQQQLSEEAPILTQEMLMQIQKEERMRLLDELIAIEEAKQEAELVGQLDEVAGLGEVAGPTKRKRTRKPKTGNWNMPDDSEDDAAEDEDDEVLTANVVANSPAVLAQQAEAARTVQENSKPLHLWGGGGDDEEEDMPW